MRQPSQSEILTVWERGRGCPSHDKALLLLGAAYPEATYQDLARLSIGERDGRLLTLRERLFGPHVAGTADCPSCGDRLELSFEIGDIRVEGAGKRREELSVELRGYRVVFRLPDSNDLALLPQDGGAESGREILLANCISEILRDGEPVAVCPEDIAGAVIERMAEADPQADVNLNLKCPACRHGWLAQFDIVFFLWSEVESWARRMLHEVHTLARFYGWAESEILAMTPLRRQCYLDMISG